ncbi:MAG: hypothetical protein ACQXXH_01500 [Candidatus Bathyarchaeia archaeon]|jgi:hypothetical protein|nr:hypothetical protein [Candidatus Bathyarchaeota archaeon A05DMB-4]MDH7596090.1 hypothetical protein [Candidatus Bathyarchaeota archaeon]
MVMEKYDKIVVAATMGFLIYALLLSLFGPVVSSLLTNKTFGNAGTVKAIGVEVFWDNNCTQPVTSFNWGTVDPNSTKSISAYIKNTGNYVVTLSMYTSNWTPSSATNYMTLTWDRESATLNAGQVLKATFTLTISASITGITNFSFDITIVGSG